MRRSLLLLSLVLVVVAVGAMLVWRARALPAPGSNTYEQTTRAFYHGLAALEVGLLDDARQQFTSATMLVPREPASWANLGLAQLRLGELEAAAEPVERALSLAPDNSDLVLLAARMETARGRLDEGVARLRQAVALDAQGLRTRFALAEELTRLGSAEADTEAQALLDELATRAPANIAIQLERARLAAKLRDAQRLRESVAAVGRDAATWSTQAREQFAVVEKVAADGNFDDAPRATTILRNVLAPVPAFSESLTAVRTPAELIAEPFDRFLVLASPPATPSPADTSLAFAMETLAGGEDLTTVAAFPLTTDGEPAIIGANRAVLRFVGGAPTGNWTQDPPSAPGPTRDNIATLDWNHDFRTDVVMAFGPVIRLFLQGQDGTFTVAASAQTHADEAGIWPADVEMDGDIDLVLAPREGSPLVLRNNGNGGWSEQQPFAGVSGVRHFAWADLDRDADPDAVFVDASGALHVFTNRQAGAFVRLEGLAAPGNVVGVTVGDIDADGAMDVITIDSSGVRPAHVAARRDVDGW